MKKLLMFALLALSCVGSAVAQSSLVYEGGEGFGQGKHIVFIANDHEYRSEQTCPALAKMMAKNFGFKCTVIFGLDEEGFIKPGSQKMPGTEVLKDADLVFFFTRFMNLPDQQVQPLVDYLERGGPIIGVRTSTHCFNGQKGKWAKLNFNYGGEDYQGGMGEQVFGNTWHKTRGQSHYGSNHKMGCTITPMKDADSVILTGVKSIHAFSGAYLSRLPKGGQPLLEVQVLNTFQASKDVNESKPKVCAAWTRDTYRAPSGASKDARVVYASFGASEDLLDPQARRFMLNACLWGLQMEDQIKPDLSVEIGKYIPTFYTSGIYVGGVKPADLAGWDSEVMPSASPIVGLDNARFKKRAKQILEFRVQQKERIANQIPGYFEPSKKK